MKYTMIFFGNGFMKEADMFSEYIVSKNRSYYEIKFGDSDGGRIYGMLSAV